MKKLESVTYLIHFTHFSGKSKLIICSISGGAIKIKFQALVDEMVKFIPLGIGLTEHIGSG